MIEKFRVIGLMSGTSLDGVDIVCSDFSKDKEVWKFSILAAETIAYDERLKQQLQNVENESALALAQLNVDYGHYLGKITREFIEKNKLYPAFISSHGHTIFHQPEKGLTLQIGSGAAIAAETNLPVICDFRTVDVAYGGQGAPLVPAGEKFLFPDFNLCLNIGGFANITANLDGVKFDEGKGGRKAFDICPANIVLNHYTQKLTPPLEYDEGGEIAARGKVSEVLLQKLNSLEYYSLNPPKSLGKEWVLKNILPLIDAPKISPEEVIATFTEHIAIQIANTFNKEKAGNVLITGGGAFNHHLIKRIKTLSNSKITVPENEIIMYKEALIFAFLGVLRFRQEVNCFSSVTGAATDNIGGAIYFPRP
jgi:anhydro-N-acetylmuramic acid kinase